MRELNLTILAAVLCVCAGAAAAQEQAAANTNLSGGAPASSVRHATNAEPVASADLPHREARYRLCASDVLAVVFPLTPEFNQTVGIEPDGVASLAGAGEIHLEGLTAPEAAAAIRTAYAPILRDPIVTVELKEFNKPYFIVTGQVNRPGKYDLRGGTSATEAVAMAGGFNDAAKHSQVLLFRRTGSDWFEVKPLNLKRILNGRGVNEDPEIRPGDMLFVPQNFISKIKRFIPSSGVGAYYQLHP